MFSKWSAKKQRLGGNNLTEEPLNNIIKKDSKMSLKFESGREKRRCQMSKKVGHNELDLKDKLKALKFIAQQHRAQFDERRRYEWKVVFTSFTFYVLCVTGIYGGMVTLPSGREFKLGIFIMFLSLATIDSIFLASLHKSNNTNKTFAERAENAIVKILNSDDAENLSIFSPIEYRISFISLFKSNLRGIWAWRWQVITLLFFAIASATLLVLK